MVKVRQPDQMLVGVCIHHEGDGAYLPATTHPQLPPPHTIISNSSGSGDILMGCPRLIHSRETQELIMDERAPRLRHPGEGPRYLCPHGSSKIQLPKDLRYT